MGSGAVTVDRADDVQPGELAAFDVNGIRIAVAKAAGRRVDEDVDLRSLRHGEASDAAR